MTELTSSNERSARPGHRSGAANDGLHISELLRRIADDGRTLLHDEVALAKLELNQSVRQIAVNASAILLGGTLALISLGLLCVTAVVALAPLIPELWLRLLVMSFVYVVVGAGLMLAFGSRLRQFPPTAPRAREQAKETLEAVAREVSHE